MKGFVPPAYPYDRLDDLRALAVERHGAAIDCSIGAPIDDPPAAVIAALSNSGDERGYPPSIGSAAYREAAADWLARQFGVSIDGLAEIAACIGTKRVRRVHPPLFEAPPTGSRHRLVSGRLVPVV